MPVQRNPLKALDDRAMDLASQDAELRAALFRFVDVVPACRSLDDLAAPPDRLPRRGRRRRPPSLRRGDADGQHAGRAARALGAAGRGRRAPHGAPLHRRRGPAGRAAALREPVARRRRRLGRPARRGDGHRRRGRPLRRALRRGARHARRRRTRAGRRSPQLERDSAGAAAAREPVGQGLRADAAAAPRGARARPARRRRRACARCCASAHELGAHLHIDMESLDSREAVLELVLDAARRGRVPPTARAPGSCCRPTCATRRRRSTRSSSGRGARRRAHPLDRAARQGRLLGPRGRRGAPARLDARRCSSARPTATATSSRSRAGCSRPRPRACASRSPRTTCARSPTRSPATALLGGARRRPRAAGPARPRRRPQATRSPPGPARARLLPGRRPRRRHGLPRAPPAREHRATSRFLPTQAHGVPLEQLLAPPRR